MAFQAPVQGLGAASLDALPSLTAVTSLSWKSAGREKPKRAGYSNFSAPNARRFSSVRESSQPASVANTVAQQQFRNVSLDQMKPRMPHGAALSDLSSARLLSSAAPLLRRSLNPLLSKPASRAFSSNSLFESFRLATPRSQWSRPTSVRNINNGNTSHNLLAHMEATANNNPTSASAQNAFYSALLRANMPEILVERYETGRYATNGACDNMYYRALDKLGGQANASTSQAPSNARGSTRGLSQEQMSAVVNAVSANARGGNAGTIRDTGAAEAGSRSGPVHVVVEESMTMIILRIVRFAIVFCVVGYAAMVVTTFAIEASGIFRGQRGGQSTEVKPEQQKARFNDVRGCDEAKEELQEVVDFLKSPDKYNQLGGKLPKGVLMVGPPGTGKTLLARAVAGEAGVPFFYMSGSEFDEVYVGVGAKRVRELFTNAKAKAPAIVFIDELDAVGGKRNERDAAYHMQTLNQMLTELDGFDQTSGVVFIAATNFPQMLDKALTRPGRFDRTVHVPLPDVRGRVDILKHYMKGMKVSTEVDASLVARGTPGFSGADLENLINQAAVHASKNAQKTVTMLDLEWAKDRVLMGAEKKSMVVTDADKLMTAYHEAGHTLVSLYSQSSDPLYKVTIMPRGAALGITFSLPEMDKHSESKSECKAYIEKCMGGKIAETLVYGDEQVTSGCSSDLEQATQVAYNMVMRYGMSEQLGSISFNKDMYNLLSPETKSTIEREVRRFLTEGEARATELLVKRRNELDLLAHALVKYETLNREEVEKVVRGESLPDRLTALPNAPMKIPELPLPTFGSNGGDSNSGSGGNGPPIPETAGS